MPEKTIEQMEFSMDSDENLIRDIHGKLVHSDLPESKIKSTENHGKEYCGKCHKFGPPFNCDECWR